MTSLSVWRVASRETWAFSSSPTWRLRDVVIVLTILQQLQSVWKPARCERPSAFMRAWEERPRIMLRNTGFFRGIDCPFYAEYGDGKGVKNGCNRPYCHFRHSQQRRSSSGVPAEIKKQRDLHSGHKGAYFLKYGTDLFVTCLSVDIRGAEHGAEMRTDCWFEWFSRHVGFTVPGSALLGLSLMWML